MTSEAHHVPSTVIMTKATDPAPSPIRIRAAESTSFDIERIVKLGRHVFAATFDHFGKNIDGLSGTKADLDAYLDSAYTYDLIKKDLDNPMKRVFVAEVDEGSTSVLAGFVMITIGSHVNEPSLNGWPNPVELQRIYVDAAHHGGGVAKQLEQRASEWARSEGYETIWLGVWENNGRARRFYTKCGYEKVGTHKFVVGEQVDTDDVMVKKL
jgi:ribosomal protein S18 acetylase RimI-like enzyme